VRGRGGGVFPFLKLPELSLLIRYLQAVGKHELGHGHGAVAAVSTGGGGGGAGSGGRGSLMWV